uniref:Uncharacterized protein n=1 Tax=Xenopus tropicalis TaxID=8364 RepID=A0A1B8XW74_XENTR
MVIRPPIYAPDPPPMAASLFSFQCLVPKERLFSVIHGVLGDIPLHPPFTPELGNERVREELPCRWSPAWVSLQALADEEAELVTPGKKNGDSRITETTLRLWILCYERGK